MRVPRLARWTRLAVATLVAAIAFEGLALASHFRYGHLTWKPVPGQPGTVDFRLTNAFRRDGYPGTHGDGHPAVGDVILETIGGTGLIFGDGNSTNTLQFQVTSITPADNYLEAVALDPNSGASFIRHTYVGAGPFVARIDTCCRIGTLVNAPNQAYRVETLVTPQGTNQSPVSSLPAIIDCPFNQTFNFPVPASDPDPDTELVWRFATPAEMGVGGWTPPAGMSINSATGLLTWNRTAPPTVAGQLWAVQVVIEDRDANTGALRTQVGVDFIIRKVQGSPQNFPPQFDPPSPCGQALNLSVGVPFSFTVTASDPDVGDSVTLNVAGLPPGATMTPGLPTSGNPVSSDFDWTPLNGDVGVHVLTFSATDGVNQVLCPVTLVVAECHLLLGGAFGPEKYDIYGHTFATDVQDLRQTFPVTMVDIPSFPIPQQTLIGPAPTLRRLPRPVYAQLVMYNPQVFPQNPSQWSQVIRVGFAQNGALTTQHLGTSNGITLFTETYVDANGGTRLRFPFTIAGM